jgi:D-inositol-3-phosphate glycosyltransferase
VIRKVAFLSMHTSPLDLPGVGDAGGMNVYVDELAASLARRGIEVTVFTRRTDPSRAAVIGTPAGYEVVHVEAGPVAPLPIPRLGEWVGEFARQVTESVLSPGSGGRETDILHSHYWLSGWTGLSVKQATGLPLANSFHTLGRVKDATRRPDQPSEPLSRIAAEREVITRSDCVIASTEYEALELIEQYGADPSRVCVNPPGIDLALFEPGDRRQARRRLGLDDAPTVLFVGRIQALKGLDVAVAAFGLLREHLPDARMMVVGGPSGPSGVEEELEIRQLAARLRLDGKLIWCGVQPHHRLPTYYQSADVLIVPSRSESFGLVAAEAQGVGLPVVAANVGGLRYVVEDGVSGFLVDGWEPPDYAKALLRVLDGSAYRDELIRGALNAGRRFGWETATDRLLELYMGIADGTH